MLSKPPRCSSRNSAQNAGVLLRARLPREYVAVESASWYASGQPEEAYSYATVFMPPDSSKEKQDNLQREAEDHKELGCPSIPKV